MTEIFQSTPSARRATQLHALSTEVVVISIHALREEGDLTPDGIFGEGTEFQSTPSARRATECPAQKADPQAISIHALREEGDAFERSRRTI